jgi:hypothetical protein
VADFNGDGFPDLALAGGLGYVILDGKKVMDPSVPDNQTFLWTQDTQDCSSAATGSSIFDFNGDGKAEVLYSDEIQFRIYDGPTGNVLFEACNTTGTLIEYPIVADVDNDGQADIIVASNAYAFNCNGVKTSGSAPVASGTSTPTTSPTSTRTAPSPPTSCPTGPSRASTTSARTSSQASNSLPPMSSSRCAPTAPPATPSP